MTKNMDRCKRREHAEWEILAHLLDGGNLSIGSLAPLATRMGAGIKSNGEPIDPPAHDRFAKGARNLAAILKGMQAKRTKYLPNTHDEYPGDDE